MMELYILDGDIIGSILKRLRIKVGISQKDMANYLNLSQSQISRIESGSNSISIHQFFKYSIHLGHSPVEIMELHETVVQGLWIFGVKVFNETPMTKIAGIEKLTNERLDYIVLDVVGE